MYRVHTKGGCIEEHNMKDASKRIQQPLCLHHLGNKSVIKFTKQTYAYKPHEDSKIVDVSISMCVCK